MHALDQQAYMTALSWADSAEQAVPGLAETAFVRGRIYFALGRRDEARAAYQQVLSQDKTYEGAWLNLGNVAFQQKQYAEALQAYKRERSLHPAPTSWHAMGGAYEALAHPDSARWAYEQALATDSSYAPAYTSLAHWHESEGAFEEALRYALRARALQPDHLDAQYTTGALLFRTGHHEEAVDHLQPIVEAQPWNYSALFTLGQALQRMGQHEAASRYLEQAETVRAEQSQVERLQRAAQERHGDLALQIETANALRRTGRLPEALAAYHLAQSLRPGNLSLQNNIATIYLQQNDTTEALTRYHRILRQDSTFAETWLNLGLHYARTGRQDAARGAWDKALKYEPGNPAVKAFFVRLGKQ
jgi:tetratricopeptide (TPR) repeat protein